MREADGLGLVSPRELPYLFLSGRPMLCRVGCEDGPHPRCPARDRQISGRGMRHFKGCSDGGPQNCLLVSRGFSGRWGIGWHELVQGVYGPYLKGQLIDSSCSYSNQSLFHFWCNSLLPCGTQPFSSDRSFDLQAGSEYNYSDSVAFVPE